MNILKPLWVWNAIIFMLLLFQGGVYGGEIQVTGQVVFGDEQWNDITQADNAKNGIDVVLTESARIITGNKPFKLFARKLEAEPGSQIIAFESGADGQCLGDNGSHGTHGEKAGDISFDVHRLSGNLDIDVQGYDCHCREVCVFWFFFWCFNYATECTYIKGGNAGHVTLRVRDHYDAQLSIIYRGSEAGNSGKVQIVSLAHLEKRRKNLQQKIDDLPNKIEEIKEIQDLISRLEKNRGGKFELPELAKNYLWLSNWYKKSSEIPYEYFQPNTHVDSEETFRKDLAKLTQLSENERNTLLQVRNDFIELNWKKKSMEEQLAHCQEELANAFNWKNAQRLRLSGKNHKIFGAIKANKANNLKYSLCLGK